MLEKKNLVQKKSNQKKARVSLPWRKISEEILGRDYDLSLVLCGDALSRKLNYSFRGKNKTANVLSFPLSENEGEIFINLSQARREAKEEKTSWRIWTAFLF